MPQLHCENFKLLFTICNNKSHHRLKSPTMFMKCVPFCNSQISCKKMRTVVTRSKKETILQWRPDVLQGWEIWICLVCNFKGKRDSERMLLDLNGTTGRQGGKRTTDLPHYLSRDHLEVKTLIHIDTYWYIYSYTLLHIYFTYTIHIHIRIV